MHCALSDFPYYASEDEIPLCEIEGKLHYAHVDNANLHTFTSSVSRHPAILITHSCLHPLSSKTFGSKVFLPVTDTFSHRLQNAWYEGGLVQVLEILADPNEIIFPPVNFVAQSLVKAFTFVKKLKSSILTRKEKVIPSLIRNPGSVVCMTWHPHCSKLAVVSSDDCVNIFSTSCQLNPVLKAKTQRHITSVAWRPLSSCEIAVGCYEGIYVWCIDPNSVISRPSISCATLLQPPRHRAISAVAWSPQGDLLASASSEDNTVYIWDVEMKMSTPLKRIGGGGVGLLSWSVDGSKLFAATTSTKFRVWKADHMWEGETWCTIGGRVIAAAWSPTSSVLLFACSSQPYLYAMPTSSSSNYFASHDYDSRTAAQVVADLTRISLDSGECVGGDVLSLEWDKNGKHLAAMFKDCNFIVIMLTNITPLFHVVPGFLIKGLQNEIPTAICFQNDFDEGANLTIAWNSGRVQYFPIIFSQEGLPTLNITTSLNDRTGHYLSFSSP